MDHAAARAAMVEHQLRGRGVRDERVLRAMGRVPREAFVPAALADEAYFDCALPIDCQQTISQPVIVALMTEALTLCGGEKVLEIGAGSGYQSAVLGELAGEVFSVERHPLLATEASERLERLGYGNVHIRAAGEELGWPEEAPFDRIIVTAAAAVCPPALWQQLAEGGVLVGPFGPPSGQTLYEIRRIGGQRQTRSITGCRFVPLIEESDSRPE